jgi:hypothetical protein
MKVRAKRSIQVTILMLATLLSSCRSGGGDEEAILQAFERYKDAILEQDGERAAGLVTRNTLAYYGDMGDLAIDAGPEVVLGRRLVDRLTIATYRILLDVQSIRQMSARELFVFAVDEGLIGSRSDIAALEVGDITVSGDTAAANAVREGQETPLEWEFRREGEQWRLDLEALLAISNLVLQDLAREAGLTENQLIYQSLEATTGQRVTSEIWERP